MLGQNVTRSFVKPKGIYVHFDVCNIDAPIKINTDNLRWQFTFTQVVDFKIAKVHDQCNIASTHTFYIQTKSTSTDNCDKLSSLVTILNEQVQ